ncbi:hypothetical protein F2Q69_00059365 [Brassica cretica]|uniref:Uncharacterized protein n=1 Tax=Brassica cretica TaxID=69181 RepID=A0A8S9RLH0_BRACR|nr:hypothetical protein F2Q69_00059365 [Brassica cretica]
MDDGERATVYDSVETPVDASFFNFHITNNYNNFSVKTMFWTIRGCTAAAMDDGERATVYDSVETPVDASNTGEEEID